MRLSARTTVVEGTSVAAGKAPGRPVDAALLPCSVILRVSVLKSLVPGAAAPSCSAWQPGARQTKTIPGLRRRTSILPP